MRLANMTDTLLMKKESRSALGKLLARENIQVNHGNYKTAYFDVKNRVLGLPDWSDKSKSVYDMLLGHEVGHALYTPEWDEDFRKKYKHFDIINILEDIRIERMIQETYAGLPRYFKQGYTELWNDGFFNVEKDPADLIFLDRLNLHAKVGSIVDIPLNDEETEIYNKAYNAKSFDDILALYDEVLERSQKEKEELEEDESGDHQMSKPSTDDSQESDDPSDTGNYEDDDFSDDGTESHSATSEDSGESDEGNSSTGVTDEDLEDAMEKLAEELAKQTEHLEDFNQTEAEGGGNEASMGEQEEFKSETQEKFNSSLEKDEGESYEGRYVIHPTRKDKFYKNFNDYKKVLSNRKEHIAKVEEAHDHCNYATSRVENSDDYAKFKKSSKKKVGILVREFEQRKAAWQYARAQESRTGSIDVTKLHKYKYDDQIFSSVTSLADAKSHGMIFLVDYSGSMSQVLSGVLLQLLNLTEFCDKVGVPYQVISFTSGREYDDERDSSFDGEINIHDIQHNEILSSKMKKIEKAEAREFLFMQANSRGHYYGGAWYIPTKEQLGGTPLDSTLANMGHIIKSFRANHRVQKLNIITLTDGDSHNVDFEGRFDKRGGAGPALQLDGKMYKVGSGYNVRTESYNKIIAEHYKVNMIGFFLPESKSAAKHRIQHARRGSNKNSLSYSEQNAQSREDMKTWRNEKHFSINSTMGYSSYYVLDTNVNIQDEGDFLTDIQDKSGKSMAESKNSQNKLAREFAKHHNSSKNVRILMRKFAETIG